MNGDTKYIRYTWFLLAFVFLVILAGGVVRMTQSGMGCPDWPRCFGRWIPPTSADQLPADFEKYLKKQEIDHTFNAYHTWIEYINRLLGALLGLFIIIHCIWSFRKFWASKRSIAFLSLFMLLATGFQGWLGKKVVDANLAVVKVTTHMLVALIIAAIPVIIISKLRSTQKILDRRLKNLVLVNLLFVVFQIILGTEVREQVDIISNSLSYQQRDTWISRLDSFFLLHRSFSWIILVASVAILIWAKPHRVLRPGSRVILALTLFSVILGLSMYLMGMPAIAQPLHLLSASLLAISLFSFRLHIK